MRTDGCCRAVEREISRFPCKERLHMPGSLTTPGRPGARDDAPGCVAFRYLHGVGTRNRTLSRLNGWPMRPPVNASPKPSRATAHDSGPMWIANSFIVRDLHSLLLAGLPALRKSSPLRPTERTSMRRAATSLMCYFQTDAPQQRRTSGGLRVDWNRGIIPPANIRGATSFTPRLG